MFQCPERLTIWSWLEEIMRQKGCKSSKENLIRGHFGPIGNLRQAFTILTAFIFINWRARNHPYPKSRRSRELMEKNLGVFQCHDNPSHPQVSEAVVVPAALTSLIWQTLGEEDVLDEIVEEGGGSGPSISALPTILSLAGIGLERGEQFWAQIVAAMKGAKESRRRKRLKPTFRTCERMLKRLRKGTSNKRLKELNKMYNMDVGDEIDFRAPSLDFEMLLKCQVKLGSSIGKEVNDVEKVLYKVHQSMLPVFPVLAFLESDEAWKLISADPWILNVVRHGLELDFEAPPVMERSGSLSVHKSLFWSGVGNVGVYKALKPVLALLRTLGFRLVIYLDDLLVLNQCKLEILEQLSFIRILLRVLGFVINRARAFISTWFLQQAKLYRLNEDCVQCSKLCLQQKQEHALCNSNRCGIVILQTKNNFVHVVGYFAASSQVPLQRGRDTPGASVLNFWILEGLFLKIFFPFEISSFTSEYNNLTVSQRRCNP
ncbi:Uncharacterized protein APZ42_031513 [Daphnia magna]|uniref:Uncharacterized protein n=1 Tax=Daphnia magna TaxID=35525 RepID=A0A164MSN4_9CRUS|nr:Uncharacterized protein APZ42_031513 [Daphnia magna]